MTGWRRLATLWCWLLAALLASGAVQAQYRHRVVLLERAAAQDVDREIATRVRAELAAAGFEVVPLPVAEEPPKEAVEQAGYRLHPASVLLVQRDQDESEEYAELWLSDRLLQKTVVLRLKSDGARDAARIAVQAVELVKARLAELSLTRARRPAPEPAAPPPPPPPPPVVPETRGARPSLTAAVGVLEGFRDGLRSVTPVVRLGVALPERWTGDVLAIDVRGSFIGLGRAARIEHGAGSASVRHTAVALDAVMRFLPEHRVQPFVALGAGFLALDVAGTASEPYRNASQRTLSGLVAASGGVWLQPVLGVGLSLEAQLLDAWSKTVVRIAAEDAAEVAAPLLLLSAGLMVEF